MGYYLGTSLENENTMCCINLRLWHVFFFIHSAQNLDS